MGKTLYIYLFILSVGYSFGQNKSTESPAQQNQLVTKPTIMVFPFVKEGEDIRTILESDINRRVVLSKVKEAIDNRGYSTVDFIAKSRNILTGSALNDAQTDVKTQIIQQSGADIAIEVEYDIYRGSGGNSVKVILKSYESSTAMGMGDKIGQSPTFRTEDIGTLAAKATEGVIVDFLNVMQEKFTDIVNNGKFMSVEFGFKEDSGVNMSTEVGKDGLPLSDTIESWIAENTKSYHINGVTDLRLIFDVVRIPRALTSTKFSLDIFKFCNTLTPTNEPTKKLKIERTIKGNTVYINFK